MAKYVEFGLPDGFTAPDGVRPGEEFQAVGTFKINEDGATMCLVDVEGQAVHPKTSKEPAKGDSLSDPNKDLGFVDAVEAGLAQA